MPTGSKIAKENIMLKKKEEIDSLAHTRWNYKHHIVFAPKYRRQVIYGQIKSDIGSILRKLCEYKGIEILEAEACPDHIHMLVSIPPKYSVSQVMGYLKGKSSLMIFPVKIRKTRFQSFSGYIVRNRIYKRLLMKKHLKPCRTPRSFFTQLSSLP